MSESTLSNPQTSQSQTNSAAPIAYIGRFAPSPTGPLHFGSLAAAVASYLDARQARGHWHLRMEDLDPPRVQPGAERSILSGLEIFGLHWDGPVVRQSQRTEAYRAALDRLNTDGWLYPCGCSRREIEELAHAGPAGSVYPGTCRIGLEPGRVARALRLNTEGALIEFADRRFGLMQVQLEREIGDFVVMRADGYFAYHLAVVVDDAELGVTDVVRGADLLDCTAQQIYLQGRLGLATPRYLHVPCAVNADGQKLSKQNHAPALQTGNPVPQLLSVLAFLNQRLPGREDLGSLSDFWAYAIATWSPERLPATRELRLMTS